MESRERGGTPETERLLLVVDFNEDVMEPLAAWWARAESRTVTRSSSRPAPGPVPFWTFTKGILYPAMKRAGIDRVGPPRTARSGRGTASATIRTDRRTDSGPRKRVAVGRGRFPPVGPGGLEPPTNGL
jgi:hypothetical protein